MSHLQFQSPAQVYHDQTPDLCISRYFAKVRTASGLRRVHLPCPRTVDCPVCSYKTRSRMKAVFKMADQFDVQHLKFLTLTLDSTADLPDLPDGTPQETPADRADRLMAGFRKVRQSASWNQTSHGSSPQYAWVIEFGNENMRPHLHLLVYDPSNLIPIADGISNYSSLQEWFKSQTIPAQKFYRTLRRHGLGAFDCQKVRSNAYGAANYMVKYLEKAPQTAKHLGLRRRMLGTSRNWPRDAKFMPRFDITHSTVILDDIPLISEYTWQPYSTMDSITRTDRMRSDITDQLKNSSNAIYSPALEHLYQMDKELARVGYHLTKEDRLYVNMFRYKEHFSVSGISYMMRYVRLPPGHTPNPRVSAYVEVSFKRANAYKVFRISTNYTGSMKFLNYVRRIPDATKDPYLLEFKSLVEKIYKESFHRTGLPEDHFLRTSPPWKPRRPHRLFGASSSKQTIL